MVIARNSEDICDQFFGRCLEFFASSTTINKYHIMNSFAISEILVETVLDKGK